MRQTDKHFVYWCYDQSGDLLYVGVTLNVKGRMRRHRAQRPAQRWLDDQKGLQNMADAHPGVAAAIAKIKD